ncbi:MAG: hypothetical protein WEC39_00625, partial [Patescibacteria group bacterium]
MRENGFPDPIVREADGRKRYFCPVEGCKSEKATLQGYAKRTSYTRHFADFHVKTEKVGIISRLDYWSSGFRQGAINNVFDWFRHEKVNFVILAGGLVALPHRKKQFTAHGLAEVAREHGLWIEKVVGKRKKKKVVRTEDIEAARKFLLDDAAEGLANSIPRMKSGAGYVKIYMVTSPASNYDGWTGAEVARRLVKLRSDIRFWGERSARFPLK